MITKIKTELNEKRNKLLLSYGIKKKLITKFDETTYEKLNNKYINGLPISMRIKHLLYTENNGMCIDKAQEMFVCMKDAILVQGKTRTLELEHNNENAVHFWIEQDNYVYDPSSLLIYDKNFYYKIHQPKNVIKYTKEEYCQIEICKKFYENINSTTIEDYKPGGKKRFQLPSVIPLIIDIAVIEENDELLKELKEYMSKIDYSEDTILNEILTEIDTIKQKSINKS